MHLSLFKPNACQEGGSRSPLNLSLSHTYVKRVENVYETKQIDTTIVRETARIVNG
jgi:hypothetical protein